MFKSGACRQDTPGSPDRTGPRQLRDRPGKPSAVLLASSGIPRARTRAATSGLGGSWSPGDTTIPSVEAPASSSAQTVAGQRGAGRDRAPCSNPLCGSSSIHDTSQRVVHRCLANSLPDWQGRGRSGRTVQLGAQLGQINASCLQQRTSGIDGAGSPAELGEVLARSPAKLGAVWVIEVSQ